MSGPFAAPNAVNVERNRRMDCGVSGGGSFSEGYCLSRKIDKTIFIA
jgi:hypothetical protein